MNLQQQLFPLCVIQPLDALAPSLQGIIFYWLQPLSVTDYHQLIIYL
jgi:hypothetical protein